MIHDVVVEHGTSSVVAFRVADYDRPLWVSPHRSAGRYHHVGSPPTQYWSLHPITAWAEAIRGTDARTTEDLIVQRRRLWTARVEVSGLQRVGFINADVLGLSADELVSDDWSRCQAAAEACRSQKTTGMVVPSAAMPGGWNAVLFGARVGIPFTTRPIDPAVDLPISIAAMDSHAPPELLPLVRRSGERHEGLVAFKKGRPDPPVAILV